MRNPIIFFLALLFTILNLADIITTIFILPAESNPLYHLTKSFAFIVIYKLVFIIVIWALYYYNAFPSRFAYFTYILILTLSIVLVGMAVYSNLYGMFHPALIEQAIQVPKEERVKQYFAFVGVIYILPLLFCLLAYKLHEWGFKYARWK
jgi:hypothetical protein